MQGLREPGKAKGKILAQFRGLPRGTLVPVEAATEAIVKKLLHGPVVRAKELAEDDAEIRLLARLFGLDPPPSP